MLNEFRVDSIEQWRGLCPALHVEGAIEQPAYRFDRLVDLLGDLRIEGYVQVPDVLGSATVEPLRDCVQLLHRSGIPLPFVSAGGTSMMSTWIAIGLLQTVRLHAASDSRI